MFETQSRKKNLWLFCIFPVLSSTVALVGIRQPKVKHLKRRSPHKNRHLVDSHCASLVLMCRTRAVNASDDLKYHHYPRGGLGS